MCALLESGEAIFFLNVDFNVEAKRQGCKNAKAFHDKCENPGNLGHKTQG
ncbi:hypothetical protein ACT7C1_10390 [Bacillus paranthracis]